MTAPLPRSRPRVLVADRLSADNFFNGETGVVSFEISDNVAFAVSSRISSTLLERKSTEFSAISSVDVILFAFLFALYR